MKKINDYLTAKAASEFLGVHINTLKNWLRCGKIKAIRSPVSGYWLYDKKDLAKIINYLNCSVETDINQDL